ncbi:MAG: ferredoxin [Thermoproteota archaeon]|nr:MAG: ferredoxin [Candidatus Korarchaeota archaeon]
MLYRVVIDFELCKGCGNCVKACSMGVLEMIDDAPYPVNLESCHGCEDCVKSCEIGAIKVEYILKKG